VSDRDYQKFLRRVAKAVGREANKSGFALGEFAGEVIADEQGEIFSFHVSIDGGGSRKELH